MSFPVRVLSFVALLSSGSAATEPVHGDASTPHWAYEAPKSAGNKATVDSLLEEARSAQGLIPQSEAPPAIWLRRVHLDLTGLPPTREELAAFAKDTSPAARRRVVDRLLASPQHGERWARHFMDIWRYSDWYGLGAQLRYSQKHIWHWRDWIVESLNADKPYDRMVQEMLAGDELEPGNTEVLRATGFLARNYYLFNRTSWLDDVIEHTSKAFLGVTMNCVKCHAHKYDPISHEDYYAFRAIFEPYHVRLDALPGQPDLEKDGLPRAYDLHLERATYLHTKGDEKQPVKDKPIAPGVPSMLQFKPLQIQPVKVNPRPPAFVAHDHVAAAQMEVMAAEAQLTKAKDRTVAAQQLQVARLKLHAIQSSLHGSKEAGKANQMLEVARASLAHTQAKPAQKKTAAKALTDASGKLAKGGGEPYRVVATLKALEGPDEKDTTRYLPLPEQSTGRRLALARWMTDRGNPLTARVLVNHLWLRHFGQPLVANVFDFGRQSKPPPLQKLLDHLAVEFMDSGWDMKHLHRLMVLSEAYAMSSSNAGAAAVNRERDPENHLYWRMNPVRMDSHTLRDSLLHLAGVLDPRMGGPTVDSKADATVFRRSLYFNHTRDEVNPFLEMFDNPNVLDCYRRAESIVPQQALAMMNARTSLAMSEKIATLFVGMEDGAFVREAFRWLLATDPTSEEMNICLTALKEVGSRAALVHTLVNHQDFIMVR